MKLLQKTQFGNPILRKKAAIVNLQKVKTIKFQQLIANMFFTMRESQGVGLAAPQINQPWQLAVIEIQKSTVRPQVNPLAPQVIINPKITRYSRKVAYDWEGCLSLDGVRGLVPRSTEITVRYYDALGKLQVKKFTGFQARVFQHEIDHLNGVVFVDRMKDMKTLMTVSEFRKRILGKNGLKSK
ncbi:MAG: peptide deformylase [Patescibacteria group bacterium]